MFNQLAVALIKARLVDPNSRSLARFPKHTEPLSQTIRRERKINALLEATFAAWIEAERTAQHPR